nr:MAG TPA: FeoB-associated Cys-rich membrane protein [Caudoviricetes sp.]
MTILVYIILIIYFLITGYLFYKLYIPKRKDDK